MLQSDRVDYSPNECALSFALGHLRRRSGYRHPITASHGRWLVDRWVTAAGQDHDFVHASVDYLIGPDVPVGSVFGFTKTQPLPSVAVWLETVPSIRQREAESREASRVGLADRPARSRDICRRKPQLTS